MCVGLLRGKSTCVVFFFFGGGGNPHVCLFGGGDNQHRTQSDRYTGKPISARLTRDQRSTSPRRHTATHSPDNDHKQILSTSHLGENTHYPLCPNFETSEGALSQLLKINMCDQEQILSNS